MKANELRLNNWVRYKTTYSTGYGEIRSLEEGRLIKVLANGEVSTLFMPDLSPIELSPEILEKIEGIVADNYGVYVYQINDEIGTSVFIKPYTTNNITKYSIGIAYELDNIINLPDLNGLHSFQNLIFALTQTELNINL